MASSFTFRGLMAPVFTPFDCLTGNVNFDVIPEYAAHLRLKDIKGILVNGTTGEGMSLTEEERSDVLRAWVKVGKHYDQIIMVQVGGTSMKTVKKLAKEAESLEVSAILCLPDLFFKPSTVDELVRYLKLVSQEAPKTPLLYYHIPSYTGVNVDLKELLDKSQEIPTFAGIKFTDSDLDKGSSCVSASGGKFAVFLGCDRLLLPALLLGFDSAIGTTINIYPEHNQNIIRYFKEGDMKRASEEQKQLNNKIDNITSLGPWPSSMKTTMNLCTPVNVGRVRDPLEIIPTVNFKFSPESETVAESVASGYPTTSPASSTQ